MSLGTNVTVLGSMVKNCLFVTFKFHNRLVSVYIQYGGNSVKTSRGRIGVADFMPICEQGWDSTFTYHKKLPSFEQIELLGMDCR